MILGGVSGSRKRLPLLRWGWKLSELGAPAGSVGPSGGSSGPMACSRRRSRFDGDSLLVGSGITACTAFSKMTSECSGPPVCVWNLVDEPLRSAPPEPNPAGEAEVVAWRRDMRTEALQENAY